MNAPEIAITVVAAVWTACLPVFLAFQLSMQRRITRIETYLLGKQAFKD